MGVEHSGHRIDDGGTDAVGSLAKAAGMTRGELLEDIRTGGAEAAFRRAVGKVEQRRRATDPRRRVVELLARRNYG